MIIQCDKCQTKFRLDDSKITGAGVKVRCTKCQNVFIVTPPIEEVQAEELSAQLPAPQKKAEERLEATAPVKIPGKENLTFEFKETQKEGVLKTEEEKAPGASSMDTGADMEGSKLDFSFKDSGVDEKSVKEPESGLGEPAGKEERPLGDFDLGLGGAGKAEKEETGLEKDRGMGLGEEGRGEEKQAWEESPARDLKEDAAEDMSLFAEDYGRAGNMAEPSLHEEVSSGDFSGLLDDSMEQGGKKPLHTETVDYGEGAASSATGGAWIVAAALVVVIGLGALYLTGVGGGLTGRLISRHANTAAKKTVDIEGIHGYFVENKNSGKVFVIEAKIKNISDSAQEIKAVKGVLYNARGEKLIERFVAPGRVVSADDLKNLPGGELIKQFKDPSGGAIPPKGTIPVMVLFTDVPAGMVEYGVDIIR